MFPVIGAYCYGKGKMSPGTEAAVRKAWKTYTPYRGDTENHWAMYHATLYLAAEQWPGLPGSEWFNGKSSEQNLNETREYLLDWMFATLLSWETAADRRNIAVLHQFYSGHTFLTALVVLSAACGG